MKNKFILAAFVLSAILIPALQQIHAANQSFDGVISDTMCGKHHMMGGSEAKCVEECVQAGSKYALVSGDKVYTLVGDKKTIAPLAGKKVHIEGTVSNNTITVVSIR